MSEKRVWTLMLGGGAVSALGLGFLIWKSYGGIDQALQEVANLNTEIEQSRKLLTNTPDLEREVIVLRETDEEIKEILPDEEDLNNVVRTLQQYERESGVRITGLKTKPAPRVTRGAKEAFKKVAYTVTLEADAFQLLEFFDRIESHERFMSIPTFKLTAASRRDVEETGVAAHKVQMEVETYVYEKGNMPDPAKIEGYQRKRELLLGEIHRRQQALAVKSYDYRGQRGRRDPWIDPRVPINDNEDGQLSIEDQLALVEELVDRTSDCLDKWDHVQKADDIIQEMVERAELEEQLVGLEGDLRRIEDENTIRFVPSQRRLQREVIDPIAQLRIDLKNTVQEEGPSLTVLSELEKSMGTNLVRGEYQLALDAFHPIEDNLALAEYDPDRRQVVKNLRNLAYMAQVALEFDALPLDIGGVAIMEGVPRLVLIDGHPYQEGDLLRDDLMIRSVRPNEIEFIYRGVILVRSYDSNRKVHPAKPVP